MFSTLKNSWKKVGAVLSLSLIASAVSVMPASAASYDYPLVKNSYSISSHYGPRCIPTAGASTWHLGEDLAAPNNANIYAIADGVVTTTRHGSNSVSGTIDVRHTINGKTYYSRSLHVWDADKYVKVGQKVKKGQRIGLVGSSGPASGPHLHLEIWKDSVHTGTHMDPVKFLKGIGVDLNKYAKSVTKTTAPTSCTYYTTQATVVRTGPASSYGKVSTVKINTKMTHKPGQMTNSYIPVRIGGKDGWVSTSVISKSKRSVSTVSADMKTPLTYQTNTEVNMRSGPSTSYALIAILPKGKKVSAPQRSSNGYSVVTTGQTNGWVVTSYLQKKSTTSSTTKPATTTKPAAANPLPSGTYQTMAKVNFRSGPATSYKPLKQVAKGTKVGKVLKQSGKWYQVKVSGTTGWIHTDYLKKVSTTSAAKVTAAKVTVKNITDKRMVATKGKSILAKYAHGSKVKLKVKKGQELIVTHKVSNGWVKVKKGKVTGYTTTARMKEVPTYKTTTAVNLRKGASTSTAKLTTLKKGQKVGKVYKTKGVWRQVKVSGKTGWVHSFYLKKA